MPRNSWRAEEARLRREWWEAHFAKNDFYALVGTTRDEDNKCVAAWKYGKFTVCGGVCHAYNECCVTVVSWRVFDEVDFPWGCNIPRACRVTGNAEWRCPKCGWLCRRHNGGHDTVWKARVDYEPILNRHARESGSDYSSPGTFRCFKCQGRARHQNAYCFVLSERNLRSAQRKRKEYFKWLNQEQRYLEIAKRKLKQVRQHLSKPRNRPGAWQ